MKIFKELYSNIHSACVKAQEAPNTVNETFLGISWVLLYDFLLNFPLCIYIYIHIYVYIYIYIYIYMYVCIYI